MTTELACVSENTLAERAVLAAIITENDLLMKARGMGLRKEDFFRDLYGEIFDVMISLDRSGTMIDAVTLVTTIDKNGQHGRLYDYDLLLIVDAVENIENFEHHVDVILRHSVARRIISGEIGAYELIDLRTCHYGIYLKTAHWRKVRLATAIRFGHRCAVCNSDEGLDVHHRTYERRGKEEMHDTIALCRSCHRLFHENGKLARPGPIDEGSPYG